MNFGQNKYKTGQWTWDNDFNNLKFVSNDLASQEISALTQSSLLSTKTKQSSNIAHLSSGVTHDNLIIKFKDTVDPRDKIRFRRYCRRNVDANDPDFVTIQDIRDVVLLCIPKKHISVQYIKYFHSEPMDFLLRSLIIYFQYFIQIWELLLDRRKDYENKIHQPKATLNENVMRDDLADLRAMVSRAYLIFITGANNIKTYHHIHSTNSKQSNGEKDVRFFEFLYQVCTQVVWIALLKRNRNLIESEINRMFRTNSYNTIARKFNFVVNYSQLEKRILYGQANINEKKLLQRSPLGKELLLEDHDFRMLAIGNVEFENADERIKYLEIAYTAPEDLLLKLNVPVGILGYPRSDFNILLSLKSVKKDVSSIRIWPKMIIPPKQEIKLTDLSYAYSTKPCKFKKTKEQCDITKNQCQKWIDYIKRRNESFYDIQHYSDV